VKKTALEAIVEKPELVAVEEVTPVKRMENNPALLIPEKVKGKAHSEASQHII
jgi:hypothetical protein